MEHQFDAIRRTLRGVFRRRKALAALTFVVAAVVFGVGALYASKEPPHYRTSATILMESRPDRVPLFQEFSPSRPLPVQVAILRSRSLAEGVLDNLPKSSVQDLIDNPYNVDYALVLRNAYRRLIGEEPEVESPQQRALTELQEARVRFESKGDGIIDIKSEASKPQVAVDLANTYIEVLISRTRSFNVDDARVTREYLEQQLVDAKRDLNEREEALRKFTAAHGGIRIPDQSQAAITQLSQAETALSEVESGRKMLGVRLRALREKAEQQRSTAPAPLAAAQPAPSSTSDRVSNEVRRLRGQLAQLEATLLDLRMKYTEEHPRVTLVKERIADLQRQLGSAVKETAAVAPAGMPVMERLNYAEQVATLETALHSVSAQEEALRRQVNGLRQSVTGLSGSEADYSRLLREVETRRNLHAMLSDKLAGARIREQGEMKVVKVIDRPAPAVPTTSQKRLKFLAVALLLAIVAGGAVPTAAEVRDRRIESAIDVVNAIDLPVLSVVPRMRVSRPLVTNLRDAGAASAPSDTFVFTESFSTLRVALQLAAKADNVRSVLVTSCYPGEGKSTVVANLGLTLSRAGVKVLLADTDFLRPSLHKVLKVSSTVGFGEMLQDQDRLDESIVSAGNGVLVAAPASGVQANLRGSLATRRLAEVIDGLTSKAEFVICDSAPVLMVPESLFLATAVDGVILVAKSGTTSVRDLRRTKQILDGVGTKFLGVVLNEAPSGPLKRSYGAHYAAYYARTR